MPCYSLHQSLYRITSSTFAISLEKVEDVNVDQTNDTCAIIRIILGTGPSDCIFPDRFALEINEIEYQTKYNSIACSIFSSLSKREECRNFGAKQPSAKIDILDVIVPHLLNLPYVRERDEAVSFSNPPFLHVDRSKCSSLS